MVSWLQDWWGGEQVEWVLKGGKVSSRIYKKNTAIVSMTCACLFDLEGGFNNASSSDTFTKVFWVIE